MTSPAITCQWTGEAFKPDARFAKIADANFVVGERYTLAEVQDRSRASHSHYFAALTEAYDTLPEGVGAQFDCVEHFRARGLIECGFYNQREFIAGSAREAQRLVAFLRGSGGYAVYSITGCAVVERTAKSQSMRAMGKADFQASKQAVLEWAWGLCGLKPDRSVA